MLSDLMPLQVKEKDKALPTLERERVIKIERKKKKNIELLETLSQALRWEHGRWVTKNLFRGSLPGARPAPRGCTGTPASLVAVKGGKSPPFILVLLWAPWLLSVCGPPSSALSTGSRGNGASFVFILFNFRRQNCSTGQVWTRVET